jgi:Icc-related predicted phosphoesterase
MTAQSRMMTMKIDCISDLHGYYPKLEGGDLLIVAGDLTARDTFQQHCDFKLWLYKQPYRKKIVIAGNHDGHFVGMPADKYIFSCYNSDTGEQESYADYLMDSGTEFEGLKLWGSPWTPTFYDWHFMRDRGESIKKNWDLIPEDTDILVTHGPPFGILDQTVEKEFVGCEMLRDAMFRIKPKLMVFGHIHEQGGKKVDLISTICVNASYVNENYQPVNKPIRIEL